jgi:hypothetical protein
VAEWTELNAAERQQAWAIFDSLRRHGPKTAYDIGLTWAIPLKVVRRELSALEDNDMVTHVNEARGLFRDRIYAANMNVRHQRYEALLKEWDGNFVDRDSVPMIAYDVDWSTERFVLVEDSTYGNGLYITVHATPSDAGDYHDNSEYPQDYNIQALIDLDTGEEYSTVTDFVTRLDVAPSERPAGVTAPDLAHEIAEALEAEAPEGVVYGEHERHIIRRVLERQEA